MRVGQDRRSAWRICALAASVLILAEEAAAQRGAFAFHYGPSLTGEGLAWYSQFELLVTHDPLPREQVQRLRAAGTRLLIYEWSVAFYESRATRWQQSLLSSKKALLHSRKLTGGVGSTTAPAWYFDPGTREHEIERAEDLARFLQRIGYDGVFFDTTTFESVHPDARNEYVRRHPRTSYDAAFSRFLAQLRRKLPDGILFTNQGYRSAEHYLPHVDWDLTESLITAPRDGRYALRPWNDAENPWSSIHFVMRRVLEPLQQRYPGVRFGNLNYADRHEPETIRFAVAVAKLFGSDAYVAAPEIRAEMDAIYFRDPGPPRSPRFDDADGQSAHQFFRHGLIAISASQQPRTIANRSGKGLRNRFTGEVSCGETITIPAAGTVPRAFFFDVSECGTPSATVPPSTSR